MKLESSPYKVVEALKSDKKDIMRFYKSQQYSASFIGHDHCYIVKFDNKIVASVILSAGQACGDYWLLHGLVIDKVMRGKKIASVILQAIINSEHLGSKFKKIICFADVALQGLYNKNLFVTYNSNDEIETLPQELKQRLKRYQSKQPNLHCYLYSKDTDFSSHK